MKTGYVHVYTGNGKGKTTASLGLALRAAGSGLKVAIHQFAKNTDCGAIKMLRKIRGIRISQCGNGPFIIGKPKVGDIACAERGFEAAKKDIYSKKYDIVILDEINIAMKLGLVDTNEVRRLIVDKPGGVELVLTGRHCPAVIKNVADLVTDMREVRHPYRRGIGARKGIEV